MWSVESAAVAVRWASISFDMRDCVIAFYSSSENDLCSCGPDCCEDPLHSKPIQATPAETAAAKVRPAKWTRKLNPNRLVMQPPQQKSNSQFSHSARSPNPQDRGDAGGLERSFCKAQGAEDRNSRQPTANIAVPQVPYDCFQLKPKAAKLLGASLGKLPRRTKPLTTRRSNQARRPSEHRDECRGQDNLQEFFRQ